MNDRAREEKRARLAHLAGCKIRYGPHLKHNFLVNMSLRWVWCSFKIKVLDEKNRDINLFFFKPLHLRLILKPQSSIGTTWSSISANGLSMLKIIIITVINSCGYGSVEQMSSMLRIHKKNSWICYQSYKNTIYYELTINNMFF